MEPRFCSQCGQPLSKRPFPDGRERLVCQACGHIAYRNAKPCAGVLPTDDGRLLLARRANEPYKGCWDIIGGFMEHDEHPEVAALREAREETGLELELRGLLGVYLDLYGPDGYSTLNLYYLARVVRGEPRPADDVVELAWFGLDDLPEAMAFPGHTRRVLEDWRRWLQSGTDQTTGEE